jgi:protein YibB
MNDITIVTAFFDIGRGDWTVDKGLPHYLHRTTDTYFERFGHMAKLENKIIVYCAREHIEKIEELREGRPTEILALDFNDSFQELRNAVSTVQNNPDYLKKISPSEVRNPEYWSADYVVVNALKSTFVSRAIQMGYVETDLVAWLDFGYCRDSSTLNDVTKWQYPFTKDKIHFFNVRDFDGSFIEDIIANNIVHMHGSMIVAGKEMWPTLEALIHHSINELLKNNLIDDDQTLMLMSYLQKPELFELHRIKEESPFIIFKEYQSESIN